MASGLPVSVGVNRALTAGGKMKINASKHMGVNFLQRIERKESKGGLMSFLPFHPPARLRSIQLHLSNLH